MRPMPEMTVAQKSTLMTTEFKGYNHNEIIRDGEMYDMKNLTGDKYPLLTHREKRGVTSFDAGGSTAKLTGIHGRDQLVFCLGTDVYYNFLKVQGISLSTAEAMCPKQIVSMGAYVCIWPDKVYFNTANLGEAGSMERSWTGDGENIQLTMCRGDGTDYDATEITVSNTAPTAPVNAQLWMDSSGSVDVLRQWNATTAEWVEVATTYVKISANGIGAGLHEYDAVQIGGMAAATGRTTKEQAQVDALNGSMIVYGAGDGYVIVAGLIERSHEALAAGTVTVNRSVPDLDYVCESNNRLWGCKYGLENGQTVNEIRASKLGDFRNWQCYMGLSTDSYTVSVGTDGPFTGAVTQKGYPVFFKEQCIHKLSGAQPANFQVTTTMCRGIQRGSWRSAAVVAEDVYYKSRDGVMRYDGSLPVSVSEPLGGIRYSDARAGAIGGKYYLSMSDGEGRWSLFVYDTEKGLWFREDDTRALGFGQAEDELYYIDEVANTLVSVRGSVGDIEEDVQWSATFGLYGTDYAGKKYLSRFNIRMYIEPGCRATLEIMYDSSGIWMKQGEIRGRELRTFMLPVVPRRCDHLRFRISGEGEIRIYTIAREMEVGADG